MRKDSDDQTGCAKRIVNAEGWGSRGAPRNVPLVAGAVTRHRRAHADAAYSVAALAAGGGFKSFVGVTR